MAATSRPWWRDDFRLVTLLTPLVLLALGLYGWEQARFSQRQIGFVIADSDEGLTVSAVRPAGPAARAGLESGDVIRSVQGMPVESMLDYDPAIRSRQPGSLTLIEVERDGRRIDVGVQPGMPFPLFSFSATALTVLAYLLIGPLALRKRPGYLRSRILFLLSIAIALEIALPGVHTAIDLWAGFGVLLSGIQLALEFHLASVIPERQGWIRRHPWVIPSYYLVGLGFGLAIAGGFLLDHYGFGALLLWDTNALYGFFLTVVSPLWAVGVLFLLGRQALFYPEAQGRQQAGIVALGVLPWALVLLASEFGWLSSWVAFRWEQLVWNLALLCYPLAVLLLLYQEATTQERILLDLTRRVHDATSLVEVSRIVSEDLAAAFHPQATHVFYRQRQERDLRLGHSSGPRLPEESIPRDSSLLRLVEAAGRAVDYPDELVGLDPPDAAWLDQLGASLVVPLRGRDKTLLGLLILGQKKSEEPYSPHDRNLLRALTHQISLIYENARLEERVVESQQIQNDYLVDHEAELLRECPDCGRCHPASTDRCHEDGHDLPPPRPIEFHLEGRYRFERRLGRGGMGAIYRATDEQLERAVAIKVLLGDFATSDARRRFENEARLTARLQHPNVVTLHDYGMTQTGAAYLVLEYLEGETLADRIARSGPLTPADLLPLVRQILAAVQTAHQQQVVHRDLKPSNIFLAIGDGVPMVKVLDFGVAKVLDQVRSDADHTTPGLLVGTFQYMAPEQLRGEEADERSDLFAVGVLLVEALVGKPPFSGEAPPRLLNSIQQGFDSELLPAGSGRLATVLRRALDYEPERRYASLRELRHDLLPALDELASSTPHP